MKTQISIEKLESILNAAKIIKRTDPGFSSTLEIDVVESADSLTGSDKVNVHLLSSYQDVNGVCVFFG